MFQEGNPYSIISDFPDMPIVRFSKYIVQAWAIKEPVFTVDLLLVGFSTCHDLLFYRLHEQLTALDRTCLKIIRLFFT